MWSIQCGICHHSDDAGKFFTTEKTRYACPSCGVVWRIQHQGVATMTESGFVIPPKKVCVIEDQLMLVAR